MRKELILDSIKHMRIPFSLFLLPVFLFALVSVDVPVAGKSLLLFFILHFLVYPSSNAYNSLQDQDTGSIGGLKNPPKVPPVLGLISVAFDLLALSLVLIYYEMEILMLVAIYILSSRLYSYRRIRIKKYALAGYLLVTTMQGGLIFILTVMAVAGLGFWDLPGEVWQGALAATVMIGAGYPISQIYQHRQDRLDGVTTISMKLGVVGTLVYSSALFILLLILLATLWTDRPYVPMLFALITLPTAAYFVYWIVAVVRDKTKADYDRTMRMNLLSTLCLNTFFLILLLSGQ